jgi:hypothetical protein
MTGEPEDDRAGGSPKYLCGLQSPPYESTNSGQHEGIAPCPIIVKVSTLQLERGVSFRKGTRLGMAAMPKKVRYPYLNTDMIVTLDAAFGDGGGA